MNLENVTYDAFISYRHCELDKFVAENLHKQLEAFKVPKSIIQSGKTNGKAKIERVFRDRDELPLASNLADPITQALQSSDYLIVICSPRLPESKWCLKEIETFIEMHGRDHILAVLIEGEPIDSFPEILRFDEKVVTEADGSTHIEKIEVEPLAADVRGKDKKEVLKQIKNELLRLVAPILDCNYDDLRMRHKEARQKKIIRISLAISIVCLIFTAISTTMALTIHKQSNTIEEQYHAALVTQAISYASISQTLLEQEDRMAAMAIARMALPDTLENQTEMPYTAAAEYALSDSLGIYNNGRNNYPVKALEQNSPISVMLVSPDETSITTVDCNNIITVYDVATASTIVTHTMKEEYQADITDENELSYLGNDKLVYTAKQGFCIYDISAKEETFYEIGATTLFVQGTSNGEYVGISTTSSFEIYNSAGEHLYSYTFPDKYTGKGAITFNTDQMLCGFTATCNTEEKENGIFVVANFSTGETIYSTEMDITYFEKCVFYDNQIIVVARKSQREQTDDLIHYTSDLHVFAYPFDNATPNWECVIEDSLYKALCGTLSWENQTIAIAGYEDITFIDSKDGSILQTKNLGAPILSTIPLVTEGNILVSVRSGERVFVSSDPNIENIVLEEYDISNGDFSDFYFAMEFDAAYHQNGNSINIYQKITSDQAKTVATLEEDVANGIYSDKQKAFLTSNYDFYYLKREDSDSAIVVAYDDYATDFFFTGENDEKIAIVNTTSIAYYDSQTGDFLDEVNVTNAFAELETVPTTYIGVTADKNTLAYYTSSDASIYLYSLKDNTVQSVALEKEAPFNVELLGINEDASKYALACAADNTLSVYDITDNKKLVETTMNASLVTNVIVSDAANCVIVSHLDQSVTLYSLSDLSVMNTFTNLKSNMLYFDQIVFDNSQDTVNSPAYVLYGSTEGYVLNKELDLVARIYEYIDYNKETACFYVTCKENILSIPYYNYEMLIQEADKQLENYQLSNYRKNQLGL